MNVHSVQPAVCTCHVVVYSILLLICVAPTGKTGSSSSSSPSSLSSSTTAADSKAKEQEKKMNATTPSVDQNQSDRIGVPALLRRLEEAIQAGQFDVAAVIAKQLAAIKSSSSSSSSTPSTSSSSDSNVKVHHQTQTERPSQVAAAAPTTAPLINASVKVVANVAEEKTEANKKIVTVESPSKQSAVAIVTKPIIKTTTTSDDTLLQMKVQPDNHAPSLTVAPVVQLTALPLPAKEATSSSSATSDATVSLQRILISSSSGSSIPSTAQVNGNELLESPPSSLVAETSERPIKSETEQQQQNSTTSGFVNVNPNNNESKGKHSSASPTAAVAPKKVDSSQQTAITYRQQSQQQQKQIKTVASKGKTVEKKETKATKEVDDGTFK